MSVNGHVPPWSRMIKCCFDVIELGLRLILCCQVLNFDTMVLSLKYTFIIVPGIDCGWNGMLWNTIRLRVLSHTHSLRLGFRDNSHAKFYSNWPIFCKI